MKRALLLSAFGLVLLSGCATAYQLGQTPDDVYYSPGKERPASEELVNRQQEEQYQEYVTYLDDRYLRMKVARRYRWAAIDDYNYWYDSRYDFNTYNSYAYNYGLYNGYGLYSNYGFYNPYAFYSGIGLGYGSYYPGYGGWGWSSPVYTVVKYSTPSFGTTSGSAISAYRNKSYSNSNFGYKDPKTGAFVPSGGSSNFGSLVKRVFSSGNSSNNQNTQQQSYDRPARTFQPATTPSTSTPASSSSSGGNSGGYGSTGSSAGSGRAGRGG